MMASTCVVTATDRNYFVGTEVMLRSLDANYHGEEKLEVYVLVPSKLQKWGFHSTKFKNIEVTVLYDPVFESEDAMAAAENMFKGRITAPAMYRFWLGDLFRDYAKAVYIDCDTVIMRDIQPLLDFEPVGALAAYNEGQLNLQSNPAFKDAAYFNDGVMVANLKTWRALQASKKAIKIAKEFKDWTGASDQDVLNIVFRNNWTPLPMSYNYMVNIFPDIELEDPLVVHWAGKAKPWLSNSRNDTWKSTWRHYKNLGPTTM